MPSGMIPIAIRWDSWYNTTSTAGQGQRCLSPQRYQYRLPWFSSVVSPYYATSVGTQAHMDTEIRLAAQAGIKCFMFDWYQWSEPTLYSGYQLYAASSYSNLVKWCGAIAIVDLGTSGAYQARCDGWVTSFQQSNYQKVLTNRPILFIFDNPTAVATYFGSYAGFKIALDYLRSQTIAAGLGSPYLVLLGSFTLSVTVSSATSLAMDAISRYAPSLTPTVAGSYSSLDTDVKAYWAAQLATGLKVLPQTLSGWDTRPRTERPETYTHGSVVPYQGNSVYTVKPPAATAVQQMADCLTWAGTTNPTACESKAILIYSWNECSEGGNPLCPTISDPPVVTDGSNPLPTSQLLQAAGVVLRASA